jgi:hypothetical protein
LFSVVVVVEMRRKEEGKRTIKTEYRSQNRNVIIFMKFVYDGASAFHSFRGKGRKKT